MKQQFKMTNEAIAQQHQQPQQQHHHHQQQQQHHQQQQQQQHQQQQHLQQQHHPHQQQQQQHLQQQQQQQQHLQHPHQVMNHQHQQHHQHQNQHHQHQQQRIQHQHQHHANQQQVVSSAGNIGGSSMKKELPANGKKTKGRVRIKMEFIHNKLRRYTTFSKRKTGIMKKAFELATLTGTQVMLLVASETGHVYTFATRKLQPMIISDAGKALIQTCLNSPDSDNLLMSANVNGVSNNNVCNNNNNNNNNGASSGASSGPPTSAQPSPVSTSPPGLSQRNMMLAAAAAAAAASSSSSSSSSSLSSSASSSSSSSTSSTSSTTSSKQSTTSSSGVNNTSNTDNNDTTTTDNSNRRVTANNNTTITNSATTTTNNQNSRPTSNGTTIADQRMSAAGFEEKELSYCINEDLNDRTFNNCLPISIGTIAGNADGDATSSASVITSPQAFEQTLQNQEAESASINDCQQQNRHQIIESNHNQQLIQGNKKSVVRIPQGNNETTRSLNNNYISYSTNKTSLIEQHQHQHQQNDQHQQHRNNNVQLLNNSMQQQVPQFSYNPLYMGPIQHYSNNEHREDKSHNNGDEISGQHLNGDNLADREGDEDEDVLNDIYHYHQDSIETNSSCNRQQQQQQQQQQCLSNFEHRQGSDMNSQYCDRSQQQSVNINGSTNNAIQTSAFINRKQDVVGQFGGIQRPQSRPQSALGSSQCRPQQQQQQQQQQSYQIQAYNDGNMQQQFPSIMSIYPTSNNSNNNNSNNNKQRKKIESEQVGGKRRLNNNNSANNFNNQFQQQQFTLIPSNTANGSHIDLSEECNGLFVEYQTNRNSLGGLEELNSLNVSNVCDGETLEEHINILSNEDCFPTNDDLQDFGIGSTNDHFLNMLFLNNNNQTINGFGNVAQSSQLANSSGTSDHLNQLNIVPLNSQLAESQHITSNASNQIICEQQQQQHQNKHLGDEVQSSSNSTSLNQSIVQTVVVNTPKTKPVKGKKNTTTSNSNNNKLVSNENNILSSQNSKNSNRKASGGLVRRKTSQQQTKTFSFEVDTTSQNKIATTNTNKRLMPKKQAGHQNSTLFRKQTGKNKSSSSTISCLSASTSASPWMASPSSTSNTSISSAMSPSNSNSQYDFEAPYRQQLENLRKKLKMDVAPINKSATIPIDDQANKTITSSLSQSVNQQQNLSASSSIFQTQSEQQEQQQQQQQRQSTNLNDQIDSLNTGTTISGNTIFVSQQQQQQQQANQKQNVLSCATTTYVIARSIDSHNFETNGTFYLRTPNGLVPIANSDRRSNLPIVSMANTNDLDYSNSTSSSTSSSSNSNQQSSGSSTLTTTSSLTNQSGPTRVIIRARPSNDNDNVNSNAETSAVITNHQVEAAQNLLLSSSNNNLGGRSDIVVATAAAASMKGVKNVDDQILLRGQIIRSNTDCADQAISTTSCDNNNQQIILSDSTLGQSNYCNERQQNDLVVVEANQYQQQVNASSQIQQQQQQHTFNREPSVQLAIETSSSLTIKSLPSDHSINVSN